MSREGGSLAVWTGKARVERQGRARLRPRRRRGETRLRPATPFRKPRSGREAGEMSDRMARIGAGGRREGGGTKGQKGEKGGEKAGKHNLERLFDFLLAQGAGRCENGSERMDGVDVCNGRATGERDVSGGGVEGIARRLGVGLGGGENGGKEREET